MAITGSQQRYLYQVQFLKKCMNDPEKAKYLEENLAAIPDCAKSAVAGCQGTLANLSYQIDATQIYTK